MIDQTRWHWKITDEQVERLKAGDLEARNEIYFDNLYMFRIVTVNYLHKKRCLQFVEDCVQQIYVDLDTFIYNDRGSFYFSLIHSFNRVIGYIPYHSLDAPVSKDSFTTFSETLISTCVVIDPLTHMINKETYGVLALKMIGQQKITEHEKDMLTAFAFSVPRERGLYRDYVQEYASKS